MSGEVVVQASIFAPSRPACSTGFIKPGSADGIFPAGAAIAAAAGASVAELQSLLLPNPVLVVANAQLLEKVVSVLQGAGAVM